MKSNSRKSVLTPFLALGLVATAFATPAVAQDLGVSISIGQPGFYGQIDIGDAPRPRILYREPRIIEHVEYRSEPIYLRVRPGHARNWERHCHEYDACGQRVYFVQNDWYNNQYAPHYREHHDHHQSYDHHEDRDDGHDEGRKNKKHHKKDHKD